jgi:hypothetical protein
MFFKKYFLFKNILKFRFFLFIFNIKIIKKNTKENSKYFF